MVGVARTIRHRLFRRSTFVFGVVELHILLICTVPLDELNQTYNDDTKQTEGSATSVDGRVSVQLLPSYVFDNYTLLVY